MILKGEKSQFFDLFIIFLFGLTPLLWYRSSGFIISGDILPPITFKEFWLQLFTWNEQLGSGTQFLFQFNALPFFLLDAIFSFIFPTIELAQKAEFVFWFLVPGFSMYIFLKTVLKGEGKRWGILVGVAFYMFNLYLEPVWQGRNIANLCSYTFVPLILAVLIQALNGEKSFGKSILWLSILSILASPISHNPPMLYVVLFLFLIYFLIYFICEKPWKQKGKLLWLGKFISCLFLIIFWINIYWIVPFVDMIFISGANTSLEVTPESTLSWLNNISKHSSLLNVSRMQGAWTWYAEGLDNEPYTAYAALYQKNLFFIGLSFLLPFLAALGFVLNRKNKSALLFGGLALSGLILSCGSHPPTGLFFEWMFKHFPFFWIVRSPWYKFTLLTCLGYAGLLALLGQSLTVKAENYFKNGVKKKGFITAVFIFFLISFQWVYAFPVSIGSQFMIPSERKVMMHNFMDIPQYAKDCLKYLESKKYYFRVFHAADKNLQQFNWGDFAFNHPVSTLSGIPTFFGTLAIRPFFTPNDKFQKTLQNLMKLELVFEFTKMLSELNVKYVLYTADQHWYNMSELAASSKIKKFLENNPNLTLEKSFGPWALFRVENSNPIKVHAAPSIVGVVGESTTVPFFLNNTLQSTSLIFADHLADFKPLTKSSLREMRLLNMGLEEWVIHEMAPTRGIGFISGRKNLLEFAVSHDGEYEIWLKLTDNKISGSPNFMLDDTSISPRHIFDLTTQNNKWIRLFKGALQGGKHQFYANIHYDTNVSTKVALISRKDKENRLNALIRKIKKDKLNLNHDLFILNEDSQGEFIQKIYFVNNGQYILNSRITSKNHVERKGVWKWIDTIKIHNQNDVVSGNDNRHFKTYSHEGVSIHLLPSEESKPNSVTLSIPFKTPLSLEEYPDIDFNYELKDFRFIKTSLHVQIDTNADGQEDRVLSLDLMPYIPLKKEIARMVPDLKEYRIIGLNILFENYDSEETKSIKLRNISLSKLVKKPVSSFDFYLDNKKIKIINEKSSLIQIEEGWHTIKGNLSKNIRSIYLSFDKEERGEPIPVVDMSYQQKNPVKYTIGMQAGVPAMIILNQSYHSRWIGFDKNGEKLPHFNVNVGVNGFWVDESKEPPYTLYFKSQKYLNIAFLVSFAGLLIVIFLFAKNIFKKAKQE